MPEISELLESAAPGPGGPAPLDDIVRRGRRRKVATRAAAIGAPLAVAAVVAGVILTGGGPTGVVVEPMPDVAESPDATPTPTPTEPGETTEPSGTAEETAAVDTSGWVAPGGLGADVLVVEAGGGEPQVVRLGADGTLDDLSLTDGVPNAAGLLPDGRGGFVWQPDWESAGPAPVLHRSADGHVSVVAESPADGEFFLVGWDEGLGRPLAELRTGTTMEDATSDLVALAIDGSGHEVVRSGIGGWETGISNAVTREVALYDLFAEANQFVVLDPPDGDPQVVYEAGEVTGEDVAGVALVPDEDLGLALISGMPGLDREITARLLFVDLTSGEVVDEVDVPLGLGPDSDAAWPGGTARGVVAQGDHVLVNRWFEGTWVAPLVYDTVSGEWSLLEHAEGGLVLGRASLTAPLQEAAMTEQAACITQDEELRNAEPIDGEIALYLPCKDQTRPGFVHRLLSGVEPTGDIATDLEAVVDLLIEPVLEDEGLAARGYYVPADRGQVVVHSVTVDDGHAVLDLGFPNGIGNLNASFAGAVWHHALRGTVFQFDGVDTLEMRLDGSCEDYGEAMQAGPVCVQFDRADAPWNTTGSGA